MKNNQNIFIQLSVLLEIGEFDFTYMYHCHNLMFNFEKIMISIFQIFWKLIE